MSVIDDAQSGGETSISHDWAIRLVTASIRNLSPLPLRTARHQRSVFPAGRAGEAPPASRRLRLLVLRQTAPRGAGFWALVSGRLGACLGFIETSKAGPCVNRHAKTSGLWQPGPNPLLWAKPRYLAAAKATARNHPRVLVAYLSMLWPVKAK